MVPVYNPVPILTSPLPEASTYTAIDWFHNTSWPLDTKYNIIEIIFPCHPYNNMYASMLLQSLNFVVQSFTRHFFIFLQNPYFTSIHTSYHNLFLSVIFMHCIPIEEPHILSYLAFLRALHNMFLKHDFLTQVNSLSTTPHVPLPFLVIKLLLFCQTFQKTSVQHPTYFTSADLQWSATPFYDVRGHEDIKCRYTIPESSCKWCVGGGRQHIFSFEEVGTHIVDDYDVDHQSEFKFIDHAYATGIVAYLTDQNFVYANIPLAYLAPYLSLKMGLKIAKLHHIILDSHVPKSEFISSFLDHSCVSCNLYCSVFSVVASKPATNRSCKHITEGKKTMSPTNKFQDNLKHSGDWPEGGVESKPVCLPTDFPPKPIDNTLSHKIISGFCESSSPDALEEAGCSVCGQLVPVKQLTRLKAVKNLLHLLHATGIKWLEHSSSMQPIHEIKGPVLDYTCHCICDNCQQFLRKGKTPPYALASGLWLGTVPEVLLCLTYIERLLVAHVHVNSCFICIASSGLRKMASPISPFESPVPKIYHRLPPPMEDLDQVLAILFTGPCEPTKKEFHWTPPGEEKSCCPSTRMAEDYSFRLRWSWDSIWWARSVPWKFSPLSLLITNTLWLTR